MALRALLFSKNPETAESLASVLKEAGIRAELCVDIFAGMEKGTKQPFACIIVDWSEQPEAGFLLKRARESGLNRRAVAIAIVDGDPTPDEEREHRLDFLIYRPIVADEARAVLAKAGHQMQVHSAVDGVPTLDHPEIAEPSEPHQEDPNLVSIAGEMPDSVPQGPRQEEDESTTFVDERTSVSHPFQFGLRGALAAVLVLAAVFLLWRTRDVYQYLGQAPEGTFQVLKESLAALFNLNKPASPVMKDVQQDAYFTRPSANTGTRTPSLGVVSADVGLPDAPMRLQPPFDFPLPTPELHVDPLPTRPVRAAVPDSIRTSAPIARPVVMAVNPQMLPVSAPPPQTSPSWQQAGEPVRLSEEVARGMMLQSVDPIYPPEAMAQKLQGPVVLQAVIARDGSVQDLKLVRGYFVLGRAAIAAVKQWKFRPYSVNGHASETQTVITINFTYPPG